MIKGTQQSVIKSDIPTRRSGIPAWMYMNDCFVLVSPSDMYRSKGYWGYSGNTRVHLVSNDFPTPPEWYIAIIEGNIDCIEKNLISNIGFVNDVYDKQTPFSLSITLQDVEIANLLIPHITDHRKEALAALAPLKGMNRPIPDGVDEITPYLVVRDNVLVFSHYSWSRKMTPKWFYDILKNQVSTLKKSIEQKPNLLQETYKGETPYAWALEMGHGELVHLFRQSMPAHEDTLLLTHLKLLKKAPHSKTREGAPRTIIAGMGPAGLSSALALLICGHDVTLIDKRPSYLLKQKVLIPTELRSKFWGSDFDKAYLSRLEAAKGLTSLCDFQVYQLECLKSSVAKGSITYGNTEIPLRGKLSILSGSEYEITAVDGLTQQITLANGKSLAFDFIIDATGDKRFIALKLATQGYTIHYSVNLPQPPHRTNAIVHFKAKTKNIQTVSRLVKREYSLDAFRSTGWQDNLPPDYYVHASAEQGEIYLVTEIPQQLLGKKAQEIIEFAKPIIQKEWMISDSNQTTQPLHIADLKVTEEDILLFSTFELKHEIAERPYVSLGKEGVCFTVGDARMPANLHFSHGVAKAIEDGYNMGYAFSNDPKRCDFQVLQSRTKQLRDEVVENMTQFKDQRDERLLDQVKTLIFTAFQNRGESKPEQIRQARITHQENYAHCVNELLALSLEHDHHMTEPLRKVALNK